MPKGKGTYGSKKGRPKKPMSFNAKRVEAVKAGKDSFEVGGKSFPVTSKAMKYKPMKHKGPYKPMLGSREKNTPGSFREEVPQMYHSKKPMMFKNNMPKMMVDTEKLSAGKRKLVEGVAKADMKPKKYHK